MLCTFTEKAALELRDRLRSAAIDIGYTGDLSSLRTGTIHGVCNEFVDRYRHLTPLGNGYEVLDELTRALFLFEHFDDVIGAPMMRGRYLGPMGDEVDGHRGHPALPRQDHRGARRRRLLIASGDPFLQKLGRSHQRTRPRSSRRTVSTSPTFRSASSISSTT